MRYSSLTQMVTPKGKIATATRYCDVFTLNLQAFFEQKNFEAKFPLHIHYKTEALNNKES